MRGRRELPVDAICCLLHNLTPGGSAWQWVRLLGRHVERGGRATIFAPPGPLAEPARAAGIDVVATAWDGRETSVRRDLWAAMGTHEAAIVHWEQGVMESFVPALDACGRAVLTLHQAPDALARWFGPPTVASARQVLERAVTERQAAVLVRGAAHRRRVATAFDVSPGDLRVLPAAVPLPSLQLRPAPGETREVLAMMRLSPEKAAVARLAVELVRERLAGGHACSLRIAGDGPWRPEAEALCERRLPPDSWRIESAPEDPIARLADSHLVVAQGLTTLEAAALGRRVVVARSAGENGAAGVALTRGRYDEAARDPFGEPPLTDDPGQLWKEVLAIDEEALRAIRRLVETGNSFELASRSLGRALATLAGPLGGLAGRLRR